MLSGIASNSIEGAQIWDRDFKFFAGIFIPILTALLISNLMTTYMGMKKPERVTSAIETCYQNCGIATSVALSMFQGDDRARAMGVPFLYGMVEFIVIGTYCLGAWKAGWTKAPPTEPFHKMITTSYEVLLAKKLTQEGKEVDSYTDDEYDVEVVDEYRNESENSEEGGATGFVLVEEPVEANVDPPAPSDGGDRKVAKEESIGTNIRTSFWRGLGYE